MTELSVQYFSFSCSFRQKIMPNKRLALPSGKFWIRHRYYYFHNGSDWLDYDRVLKQKGYNCIAFLYCFFKVYSALTITSNNRKIGVNVVALVNRFSTSSVKSWIAIFCIYARRGPVNIMH